MLVVLALAVPAGTAEARTDWARGDRAFRAGEWSAAESLYTRRLARGAARAAEVNRATARAEGGKRDSAETDLARLAERADEPGRAAGYNLGTMLGRREAYDDALKQLRRQLERDPGDADARWNYEWVLRKKKEEQQRKQHPDRPQSSGGEAKPSPSGSPQPSPSSPSTPSAGSPPATSSQGVPEPQPSRGMNGGMDRTQAEQILNALDEQSRLQQGQKRVRVVREKRGRDW
jgi:tetratricopeptide (TPR) repeat protein